MVPAQLCPEHLIEPPRPHHTPATRRVLQKCFLTVFPATSSPPFPSIQVVARGCHPDTPRNQRLVGNRARRYRNAPLADHPLIRRTNDEHDAALPQRLKLIDAHCHVAEGWVCHEKVGSDDALHYNKMIDTLRSDGGDHRGLFHRQVLERHSAEAVGMISPRFCEVLQGHQRKPAASPHSDRIDSMQYPHHDRGFWRRVLEVVSQHGAQCCSAAAHIPLLPGHALAPDLLQAADILTSPHPRRLSRILGKRGCREENGAGQSNNQPKRKHVFLQVHQCFPVRLVCVRVPTVELILTFRFSSTLTFEFTALILTSEVRFCCAPPFNVSVPWFWVVVVPASGAVRTAIVPDPVTTPFGVGTVP